MAHIVRGVAGCCVTPEAFARALFRTYHGQPFMDHFLDPSNTRSLKVVAAVSGGADSMALAYLLRNTPHPIDPNKPAFLLESLIVDHGVREDSSAEAHQVQQNLLKLNISAQIQRLAWPAHDTKSNLKLEGNLRTRRYKSIATYAQRWKSMHVFTGHHADDNFETILGRLVRNRQNFLLALRGMEPCSPIPQCQDMHGVHARGLPNSAISSESHFARSEVLKLGMQLHRPLLSFTKADILATCAHFDIPYVHDPTNDDPGVTVRNTIRKVRSYRLPKALQPARLLSIRDATRSYLDRARDGAFILTQNVVNIKHEAWSSELTVSIRAGVGETDLLALRYLFARLLEFVSPLHKDNLPLLLTEDCMISMLNLNGRRGNLERSNRPGLPFSQKLVKFTPLTATYMADCITKLRLNRQPMRSRDIEIARTRFGVAQNIDGQHYSEWHLWDNRFWLRLRCSHAVTMTRLEVRPFSTANVKLETFITQKYGSDTLKRVSEVLQRTNHESRASLPALFHDGELINLPTAWFLGQRPDMQCDVEYAIADRAVDFFNSVMLKRQSGPLQQLESGHYF